ncbi:FISUMP domain-containing protein [Dysgonomonas sp. 25]|uniref:FISUMP domain-containing protein n=1 Tax=Dysgonomonas sp. 25 TaxID=2302933 RepID=UPI0016268181|nr:FISUMP domain-containing protein [Dysgonomonas sp. 25]
MAKLSNVDISLTIDGVAANAYTGDHTGLTVYNVSGVTPKECADIMDGLYVWDGTRWQQLGKKGATGNIGYEPDNRAQLLGNQSYPYSTFGNAGTWMLENMRYIPNDGSITAKAGDTNYDPLDKYYTYPNPAGTDPGAIAPTTWSEKQGLLYSYAATVLSAAQDGYNDNQQQIAGATPGTKEVESLYETPVGSGNKNGKIQGICPPGWHVPSDREWNELEKELYENAKEYSHYTTTELGTTTIWNPTSTTGSWTWDTTTSWRGSTGTGGHGMSMMSPCKPPSSPYGDTDGKSLPTAQGGFNALLVGSASGGLMDDLYGYSGCFWSASARDSGWACYRVVFQQSPRVFRGYGSRSNLCSVRCKKND